MSTDRFSPCSREDHMARGKTVAKIDGQRLREREQQLVETIADYETELDNPCLGWPEEIRSLNDRLESAQDELQELRRQRAEWEERGA